MEYTHLTTSEQKETYLRCYKTGTLFWRYWRSLVFRWWLRYGDIKTLGGFIFTAHSSIFHIRKHLLNYFVNVCIDPVMTVSILSIFRQYPFCPSICFRGIFFVFPKSKPLVKSWMSITLTGNAYKQWSNQPQYIVVVISICNLLNRCQLQLHFFRETVWLLSNPF